MSYVVINALTVPGGNGELLEQRFAGRAGLVDQAEGFEAFQLLRPIEGTDKYLVYTRWRSAADFEAWQNSRDFGKGHAQAAQDRNSDRPASSSGEVWQFEVIQSV
ncbi:MAG TPA: antibiotic biosynthesis monooxygenase [Mycobacteriales bacterium]|jgi:heme-degrading monooxygenase HmoA|nr:antibiotic biosynthesis monooxygenase [Mycobacteriales bacterium]